MFEFHNICSERVKLFVRFKRLRISPKCTEKAFSSCWISRGLTIICLSSKEIRIQRDLSNTDHNLLSGFSRSIRTVKELNRIIFVVVPYFDNRAFFPELSTINFCSGATQRGAHHRAGCAIYCRVQYLCFTHESRLI
jgi:hypothetical protein